VCARACVGVCVCVSPRRLYSSGKVFKKFTAVIYFKTASHHSLIYIVSIEPYKNYFLTYTFVNINFLNIYSFVYELIHHLFYSVLCYTYK
jgi:hypothetical protein